MAYGDRSSFDAGGARVAVRFHERQYVQDTRDAVVAAVIAVVGFFVHEQGNQRGAIFTVCCVLYLVAPVSIVRDLVARPAVDGETLLGAVAAYVLIGMFFAFAYKAASEFGKSRSSAPPAAARSARICSSAS